MWELDYKECWAPTNWCFWTVVLEKTLESPLDGKENKPVNSKGNQPWIFIGRTDAEAETPILWPPSTESRPIRKYPDAGKDWRLEKGMTEDEMFGWHHRLYGHEFEQALGDGEGQGSLECCSPWGCKESDTTKGLTTKQAHCNASTGGASSKEPACQYRRHKRCWFDPWAWELPWRRKWQLTPVCMLGESHGQRSLVGYSPWVTESQTRLSD